MVIVTPDPIDPCQSYQLVTRQNAGSVVFHYAVVKEQSCDGKGTIGIEYHSDGDSAAELDGIVAQLKEKWDLEDVLLVRRVGKLRLGDVISLVAASSPNSEDAFTSCRHGISLLKKMKTIRKTEIYG